MTTPLKISQLPDGGELQDDDEFPVRRGTGNVKVRWANTWPVLVGPKGDKGDPGDSGQNGSNGADGLNGSDGAAGDDGADGREIELQKSATHVQWRYVGDAGWTNLVALADITGPAGADGADGEDGVGGAPMLTVPLVADGAGLVLTNMALALGFLGGSHRFATKVDLTGFTQVRLVVNKQATAGAAASKIILRYITAFSTTVGNWLDIGASEVSVAINVQTTVLATAWINLATLAKADVFITPVCSGGDGALDPAIGSVVAQFK